MSLIPEVPVQLLSDYFTPFEVLVEVSDRGVLLRREQDQRTYVMAPTPDGFVRGTALQYACRYFEIDALDLLNC